ncbi:type II toxin-antitoxin system RelB/DinJ family antitoxin [Providencia hangzhouensis]|uniref:type II toxin-antitoxin system RelB/DinJ family antitoxin n=1 Tax=Providencia hangzhouensis TaxID=3031799 RepID=UPI0034DD094E
MISDTTVKARISQDVKERAVSALAKMGLNTSDSLSVWLTHICVADEGNYHLMLKRQIL